jgi:hypothetical protein
MARPAAAALVLLALVAAGCGAKAGQTFTAAGTVACLRSEGFTEVTRNPKNDLIAAFAANGGIRARASDGNRVTIAFATDEAEAASTRAAYRNHASPFYKKRMNDIMQSDGNAVMVWTTAPSQAQIDTVKGCLSS